MGLYERDMNHILRQGLNFLAYQSLFENSLYIIHNLNTIFVDNKKKEKIC